ncbi:MAG: glycosyltransferase family 4 protein [Aggregatilineales bacterium]
MRIGLNAHLLNCADGYRRAGIHGYIYQLLAHLPAAAPDWQFTVFVGAGDPPDAPQFTIKRSRWNTERPTRRILWEQLAQPFQLGGLDLIHELAFVAPVVMPRPFVVTVYDLSFLRYPERLTRTRRLYLRRLTDYSCRRARRVIAISQSTADDLTNLLHIPSAKIDLAVPGVEARFQPLPAAEIEHFRAQKGLPDRFMLFVGTIEARKNLPVLLRAYAAVPAADRAIVHLILAGGKGWLSDDVPRTVEQFGLGDTVHLPGYVADKDLPLWYNAAETFVYPSVYEGWGLPVTEAMACGTPVIVSTASALPEAVGEAGLCVPPDNVPAWTDALAKAIHDPTWRTEYGERGQTRAAGFSWANTAAQIVASYRRALSIRK